MVGGFTYNNKKRMILCAQNPSFSIVYINCLMKIVYAENLQKQQLCMRAINMKMKGSVHEQKNFTDPKFGRRFVFLVLSCYVFHNRHEHHHIKSLKFQFLHKLLERGV